MMDASDNAARRDPKSLPILSRESQHTWEPILRNAKVQTPRARKALRPPLPTPTPKELADYVDADEVALGIGN